MITYDNFEFGKEIKLMEELKNYKDKPIIIEFDYQVGFEDPHRWIVMFNELRKQNGKPQHDNTIAYTQVNCYNPYPLFKTPNELFSLGWRKDHYLMHKETETFIIQGYDKLYIPTKEDIRKYGIYTRLRDFIYS